MHDDRNVDEVFRTAPLRRSADVAPYDGQITCESGRPLVRCFKCKHVVEPREIKRTFEASTYGVRGRGRALCARCDRMFKDEFLVDYLMLLWTEDREGAANA